MVDKITSTLKPSGLIAKINEIIDNLGGGSSIDVDQTYDGTSVNAQSGVAIEGARFLQNTATGTNALTVDGTASTYGGSVNIGYGSSIGAMGGVALGYQAFATGYGSTSIGGRAETTAASAIQIGAGTNSTANSLSIGFSDAESNYELLDGTTGLIPDARISSNIARASAIPTVNNATLTIMQGGTTKGTFTANASSNVTIDLDAGGSSRNIGEIISSAIPLTDAGLHLLDGSLISGSGAYADFVTYIAGLVSTYPDLFDTEANWQTSITTYGVCGKFVYDSVNNTVRLPKITGIIEGTTDLTALGDLVEAGLPNITGSVSNGKGESDVVSGAFSSTSGAYNSSASKANNGGRIFYLDASRSSSIYGNSTTVQPQTIKVLYYIVIATSTKTSIEVDIDEIATDLNGKADTDLSNVPTSKGILSESYVNGTSWYRVYSDGWCEQGGYVEVSSSTTSVSLLKPYIDTSYNVQVSTLHISSQPITDNACGSTRVRIDSVGSFSLGAQYIRSTAPSTRTAATCYWRTCGYIN